MDLGLARLASREDGGEAMGMGMGMEEEAVVLEDDEGRGTGAWIPGQNVTVDHAALVEILIQQLEPDRASIPFPLSVYRCLCGVWGRRRDPTIHRPALAHRIPLLREGRHGPLHPPTHTRHTPQPRTPRPRNPDSSASNEWTPLRRDPGTACAACYAGYVDYAEQHDAATDYHDVAAGASTQQHPPADAGTVSSFEYSDSARIPSSGRSALPEPE